MTEAEVKEAQGRGERQLGGWLDLVAVARIARITELMLRRASSRQGEPKIRIINTFISR